MPIVSRGDDDNDESAAAAGAPPFDTEFDPNDPDQVKVHYNLTGWNFEQHAELAETLAERGIPHAWSDDELVVPEAIEGAVDALFEELEREIGPFPVPLLDEHEGVTEFDLDEWPAADIEVLTRSLVDAEIPHRWAGRTLLVASDAEDVVDDLLDAIEAGETASLDESVEAPDGALNDLYVAADRLVRDAHDAPARASLTELVPALSPEAPPYGLAGRTWTVIVDRARALVGEIESGADLEAVSDAAGELRAVCRPYV